ncbi:M23 family metallopeptidase [Psychroflexus sp. ALD_RP9]|uniref:M23 family metallopeptidase n=1 Tax=Psychroflexus sp. ALD_RP9 TaxID=2777186 RepID=UPI001A8C5FFE|nr:M23 family metallopeptidase [Psychroflexus sp. ALD_RP9]QSS98187.1 M23 family metallopeptidase [Psychroflexus sp. ALD_RP9]
MTKRKKKDKKKFSEKLLHKYRLVILNEDTFEERVAFKLSRLNVISLSVIFSILLIVGTSVLIVFTPLKEYIPGYSSSALKQKATRLSLKVDSLENQVAINNNYYQSIRAILSGEIPVEEFNEDSTYKTQISNIKSEELQPTLAENKLRERVESNDKFNLLEQAVQKTDLSLFPPVTGRITEAYNAEIKHYAVDIVTVKDKPVKTVADGTVIFSEWTASTGYVIIIEHSFGLISVYKHNAELLKAQGDLVKSGEVIAITGNTGELSTGPHLHFELWVDGYPVNPQDYITFEE